MLNSLLHAVTFVYTVSFFYYFIVFRQLYKVCSKVRISCPEIWLLCLFKYRYCCEKLSAACRSCVHCRVRRDGDPHNFNFTAFFIAIQAGFFLAGAEFFVIYSLEQLPIALASVPIGIYHAIQLAFVLITGLFTYNIISKPNVATN